MFSDNEPSCLSAHLSFSVINVKEDSFLMVRITHVAGKFLPRNNLHLLSSVCLCGLFHSGVIYCSTISLALISHSSGWDVIFFSLVCRRHGNWKCLWLSVLPRQLLSSSPLAFSCFFHVSRAFFRACLTHVRGGWMSKSWLRFKSKMRRKQNRVKHLHSRVDLKWKSLCNKKTTWLCSKQRCLCSNSASSISRQL